MLFIRHSYYVDDVLVMTVDPVTNFWDFGGLGAEYDNPWVAGEKMAPFDQKVRLELFKRFFYFSVET